LCGFCGENTGKNSTKIGNFSLTVLADPKANNNIVEWARIYLVFSRGIAVVLTFDLSSLRFFVLIVFSWKCFVDAFHELPWFSELKVWHTQQHQPCSLLGVSF
jgi:hypothetical protein